MIIIFKITLCAPRMDLCILMQYFRELAMVSLEKRNPIEYYFRY